MDKRTLLTQLLGLSLEQCSKVLQARKDFDQLDKVPQDTLTDEQHTQAAESLYALVHTEGKIEMLQTIMEIVTAWYEESND